MRSVSIPTFQTRPWSSCPARCFCWTNKLPSGELTFCYGKSRTMGNPLFRLGHFQVRKLLVHQRRIIQTTHDHRIMVIPGCPKNRWRNGAQKNPPETPARETSDLASASSRSLAAWRFQQQTTGSFLLPRSIWGALGTLRKTRFRWSTHSEVCS